MERSDKWLVASVREEMEVCEAIPHIDPTERVTKSGGKSKARKDSNKPSRARWPLVLGAGAFETKA